MSLRRLSALVGALVLGVSTAAMAQTAAPEIEIVDINGSRYAEGGQTQMVVEFRNLRLRHLPSSAPAVNSRPSRE